MLSGNFFYIGMGAPKPPVTCSMKNVPNLVKTNDQCDCVTSPLAGPVLCLDLSSGRDAHCGNKCVWLAGHRSLLVGPSLALPRLAGCLSTLLPSWASTVPCGIASGNTASRPSLLFHGLLLSDCYSVCFIKREREGETRCYVHGYAEES